MCLNRPFLHVLFLFLSQNELIPDEPEKNSYEQNRTDVSQSVCMCFELDLVSHDCFVCEIVFIHT